MAPERQGVSDVRVPYVDLAAQFEQHREALLRAVQEVMASGAYILGPTVESFERRFAELCGVDHAVSVANGTDALVLALKGLGVGPGDEVVTVPNSWISSASCIALCGAEPVFVDVRQDQNMDPDALERAFTERTRAVIAVHWAGRCAEMDAIAEVCRRRRVPLVEDAAQAVGSRYRGAPAGSLGDVACFSFHPLKNLNAMGDGGAVTTSDAELAERVRLLRDHGREGRDRIVLWGTNSRLDAIQAAILESRLETLDDVIARRRSHAARYRQELEGVVVCPCEGSSHFDSYHLFVIQTERRDELKQHLRERGIESAVHYPVPIHLQPCARELGYQAGSFPVTESLAARILSLPVHQALSGEQIDLVIEGVRSFFGGAAAP